jgi:hypothetical protein
VGWVTGVGSMLELLIPACQGAADMIALIFFPIIPRK